MRIINVSILKEIHPAEENNALEVIEHYNKSTASGLRLTCVQNLAPPSSAITLNKTLYFSKLLFTHR